MDLGLWALIAGTGWASGVNLYLVASLLGLAGRLGLLHVPGVLTRTDVLAVAIGMFLLEFLADKIPLLDSLWDAAHTVIRPVGATLVGYALAGDVAGWEQLSGAATSGALALASHLTKATIRAAINTSPEPVSNVVASVAEDGMVVGVIALAVATPLLALVVVGLLLVAGTFVATALFSAARRGRERIRARRARQRSHDRTGAEPPVEG
jgi:hypothetical protein